MLQAFAGLHGSWSARLSVGLFRPEKRLLNVAATSVFLVLFAAGNNAVADGVLQQNGLQDEQVGRGDVVENSPAKAYFAGGCFWGVEFFFEKQAGVSAVVSGYMGGQLENPSYYDVSYTHSGYVEVVEVQYDPGQVSYETLARLFFEIHDPTQIGAQGPDVGDQYASMIFYRNTHEKKIAEKLIGLLGENGFEVATVLQPKDTFWRAEENHQDYYSRKGGTPYCHGYTKRF